MNQRPVTRPALTEQEWTLPSLWSGESDYARQIDILAFVEMRKYHGAAALCLHTQTFGFTREDIEAVLCAIPRAKDAARMKSLAARLCALLPPQLGETNGSGVRSIFAHTIDETRGSRGSRRVR